MVLRSDEMANEAEIERDERFRSNVGKGVGAAASIAGAGIAGRVMPFLSQYVPMELAMKGINKVSPKLGAFLQKGKDMGLNVEEGLQFVKDKFSPKESQTNTLKQYFPEVYEGLKEFVKATGKSPRMAILHFLQRNPEYKDKIKKMEKEVGKDMFDIAEESLMDQMQQAAPDQQMAQAQPAPQQPQAPQQGGGQGQAALMDILAKINSKLGQ